MSTVHACRCGGIRLLVAGGGRCGGVGGGAGGDGGGVGGGAGGGGGGACWQRLVCRGRAATRGGWVAWAAQRAQNRRQEHVCFWVFWDEQIICKPP